MKTFFKGIAGIPFALLVLLVIIALTAFFFLLAVIALPAVLTQMCWVKNLWPWQVFSETR